MLIIEEQGRWHQPIRLGVLGGGSLGRQVIDACREGAVRAVQPIAVVTRSASHGIADYAADREITWCSSVEDMLARGVHLVVEAASVEAAVTHTPALLAAGVDVILLSVGALAVDGVETAVQRALRSGATLVVPEGAAAGVDLIRSSAERGLMSVAIDVRVPADHRLAHAPEYTGAGEPVLVFAGSARDAGRIFPRFLNFTVAAALAAGDLDATDVTVTVDPAVAVFSYTLTVRTTTASAVVTVDLNEHYRDGGGNITSASVLQALSELVERRRVLAGTENSVG